MVSALGVPVRVLSPLVHSTIAAMAAPAEGATTSAATVIATIAVRFILSPLPARPRPDRPSFVGG